MKKNERVPLTGKAEFSIHSNDMFWRCTILDTNNQYEFFSIRWAGYNDAYWWDNVAEDNRIKKSVGTKGSVKKFKLDYKTLEVVEVFE